MNKQNSISLYNQSIFVVKETWFDSSFDILIGVYNIKIMIDMFEFLQFVNYIKILSTYQENNKLLDSIAPFHFIFTKIPFNFVVSLFSANSIPAC